MLHQQVLDFLSAYYPRYLCPPCLAALLEATEEEVWRLLTRATTGVEFATAYCLNCRGRANGVRFRTGVLDGRAG
jgi:uncharacterized protein with PIN domain